MTGLFLADYSVYGFLPDIITTYSLIYGFALFMAFLGYNFYGWLSDKTGRKSLTQRYCVFLVAFGIPVFYVLYHTAIQRKSGDGSVGHGDGGYAQTGVGRGPCLSLRDIPQALCWERGSAFTSGGRSASRRAVALRVLGLHRIPFVAAIEKQDLWLSPAIILTIGSVMTFVTLFYSPETKDLQLDQVGELASRPQIAEVKSEFAHTVPH